MTVTEIRAAAEKYTDYYEFVGIRTQEETFELGSIEHVSSVWDDGEETGETLTGISVTDINSNMIIMHSDEHGLNYYYGKHLAVICGNSAEYGADEGELIIEDAVVVEILK